MEGGTGVFYQVMPAVGVDGKNVMKLIPVQKVNGKYIPVQSSSKADSLAQTTPHQPGHITQSSSQHKVPVVKPTGDGYIILAGTKPTVRLVKKQQEANSPKVVLGHVHLPIILPKQTQNPVSPPKNVSGVPVRCSSNTQLPVTVSSPRLPNGHYLQIPPDAKVQTIPASALPQSIKKQILKLPLSTTSTGNASTVVYVSPVNSMKVVSSKSKELTSMVTDNTTAAGRVLNKDGLTSPLSTPVQSQKPAATSCVPPMKWVVQQSDSSAPCLVPFSSASMTTDILKAVAQRENKFSLNSDTSMQKDCQKPTTPSKGNALVMYNGKVYVVTKKDSELCKSPKQDLYSANNGSDSGKLAQSPSSSAVQQTEGIQNPQSISSHAKPDEVIDLCDDDSQMAEASEEAGKQDAGSTTDDDDSNVIFVSYIPPKTSNAMHPTNPTGGAQPEQASSKSTETKQASGNHETMIFDEVIRTDRGNAKVLTDRKIETFSAHSKCSLQEQNSVCRIARTIVSDEGGINPNTNSLGIFVKEVLYLQVGAKLPLTEESIVAKTDVTQNKELKNENAIGVTSQAQEVSQQSQHEYDCKMRQRFGITKCIKIYLKPVSEKTEIPPETRCVNKRTLEGIRKLIKDSQMEVKAKRIIESQVNLASNAKRIRVALPENVPERIGQSQQPYVSTNHGQFSIAQRRNTTISSNEGFSKDSSFASVVIEGRVGPANMVKEQFNVEDTTVDTHRPPAHAASNYMSKDIAASLQVVTRNPQVPVSVLCNDHVDMTSQSVTSEPTISQPKVVCGKRNAEKVDSSPAVCKENTSSANEEPGMFSTETLEPEEIKCVEKIKRLKELLKEKEAALEKMKMDLSLYS